MCMKKTCGTCGKATWAGCGNHIETALRGVAEKDRCSGWQTGQCQGVKKEEMETAAIENKPAAADEAQVKSNTRFKKFFPCMG